MDHLGAAHMKAVERYLLGDLSVSEVEEFERHFFDCPQCSEELRALTIFQENARAVFGEQDLAPKSAAANVPESTASAERDSSRRRSPLFSFPQWAMAFAALVVGIFAGYLTFGSRESAQMVSTYPLYAQSRGEETIVSPKAAAKFYTLYFDKTWEGDYSSYRAALRDSSGAEKLSVPIVPGAPGEAIDVLIPTHQFPAGRYVLVMMGSSAGKESELARFPYTLQFK
jgi:hypothetical protein